VRTMRLAVAVAALATSSVVATPGWARTAFQEWAQGQGVYVSSKAHPPELSQFFEGVAAEDGLPVAPPPYYDPYGRTLPPAGYYAEPGY
jgi:hypothetical protein